MQSDGAKGDTEELVIGVLALQGSFREHIASLRQIEGVRGAEVRTREQLQEVDGLIIPGGESTTMALIAERWGLIPELKQFAKDGRPIWGTCAGLIFLADRSKGQKAGGQQLLGGLDCTVHRNFFGAQINSFETQLPPPECLPSVGPVTGNIRAVFIRAPAVIDAGPSVETLASYKLTPEETEISGEKEVAVAVRSKSILATAFHPELTDDIRWHHLFVHMVRAHQADDKEGSLARTSRSQSMDTQDSRKSHKPPNDLPIYHR